MKRRAGAWIVCALTLTAIIATGCGSDPTPDEEKAAAIAVTTKWVDQDDCTTLSDEYVATWGDSASDGLAQCRKETFKGLQKGQYKVATAVVNGDRSTVTLAQAPNGEREYELIKQGGDWKVNSMKESLSGDVGDRFPYRAAYTENDKPIEENLEISVLSVKDNARRPEFGYGDKGKKYVRVRAKIRSNGPDVGTHSTSEFTLVDQRNQRYNARSDYEPMLGNETIELTPEDTAVGYISFLVPQKTKLKEIRWSAAGSNDSPIIWKVD